MLWNNADTGFLVMPIAMMTFGGFIFYRSFRLEVRADGDGLVVRNNFRTRRFAWSEVEGFRVGRPAGQFIGQVISVLIRNGDLVPMDVTLRAALTESSKAKIARRLDSLQTWVN